MSTILIAGGTGLIGRHLSKMLTDQGHKVQLLSRRANTNLPYKTFVWDVSKGEIDEAALASANFVINFAGAGIADKRWTRQRKKLIIESRVKGNELLAALLPKYPNVKAYISASAIGYYGDRGTELLIESAKPGDAGFLAESVIAWENSINQVAAIGLRTVSIRIGIALSTKGGALEKLLIPFNFWLGVYFGNGKQIYSWIHIEDLCRIFIKAIEDKGLEGPYNGVAPNPVTNKEFTEITGKALGKSALLIPSPSFAIRLGMGEMADVVLTGSNVSSKKIEATGFKFEHPSLKTALKDILSRKI